MTDRINQLEALVATLTKSLEALQSRVAALEGAATGSEIQVSPPVEANTVDPATPEKVVEVSSSTMVLPTLGRTLIMLAGAFLLRALTEGGILPQAGGVTLGLTYATTLIVLADRAGRKQLTLNATFHGIAAVLIAYPLIWEATTKLTLLSPVTAAAVLTLITAIGLLVAWRSYLRVLAWAFTLAALATILALYYATRAMELYAALLLLLGATTLWFAYSRKWHVMRWYVAIIANSVVLRLTLLVAHPEGPRRPYEHLSVQAVQWLALSLVVVYLVSFCIRTLARRREVTSFEILQSALTLLVGFGGAVRIAQVTESGSLLLGWAALVAAAVCYPVAFAFVRPHIGRGVNFFYFAWLALVFLFLGSRLVANVNLLAMVWIALAVAAAFLGGHYDRVTLRTHSAVYLAAAAVQTGLMATAMDAFTAPAGSSWGTMSVTDLVVLAVTMACYGILVMTQRGREVPNPRRIPRFTVAILSLIGGGSLLVIFLVKLLGDGISGADSATVAVVRTGVLAASAIGLAAAGKSKHLGELRWLVYPILVVGGIKLLVEDLRTGRPLTLFLGFACFGTALIATSRMLRVVRKQTQ